jgi:YD repeat-containing protein
VQQMMTRRLVRILVVVLAFCATVSPLSAVQASSAAPVNGQTATLLPNGGVLLAGGQDASGHASAVLRLRDLQGAERPVQAALQLGRTGHTATVLPDGTVLILGGIGADGQLVTSAEIFDPQSESSQLLGSGAPSARTFHSATVLTDGRVLISGGVGANGEALASAELWDARRQTVTPVSSAPCARRNHAATLLPDGRVLLTGGKDASGNPVAPAEAFDPQSQTFSVVDAASLLPPKKQAGQAQAFSPQDGVANVPIDGLIALRFSRALRMESITDQAIILNGPSGMVEAKIVGAEAGMLAFITPQSPLLPGTTYLVRLSGAVDADGTSVVFKEFTFTTAGDAPQSDIWNPTLDWMTHNSPSAWQNLPPLRARAGVTAIAGQVLKLDGAPLAHVKLQIGAQAVFSDGTGRFMLENLAAGHNVMMIFGDLANTPLRKYGVYEVGVDVKGGITNVLSYVIWMTPLDTAHAVKIPSPTMAETVVTSPLLPGLELHLPANTVITDARGNTVTEITITPVPLDRPPFPLPQGVPVPIYFTIQPGVSYIKVLSSTGPKGARLFYPNAHLFPPRTPFQFWNYDADQKGWFIYGQGHVSADRSQVVPDPGVEIYEFTGAMVSNPGNGPSDGPQSGNNDGGGDPIDMGTGLFVYSKTDLILNDLIPIVLSRSYRHNDPVSRSFGVGTGMPYDMFLVGDNNTFPEGYTFQDLILPHGGRIHFQRTSPCTGTNGYCDFTNAVYEHTSSATDFYGAILKFQNCSPSGIWTLTKKDGTVYCFPDSDASNNGRTAAPNGLRDRYGNSLIFTRDGSHNLTQISTPNGRWINFTYDAGNRITQAQDNIGRTVTYSYDAGGRLTRVVDANGGTWNYTYDAFSQMTSIQDPRGIFYLANQYDQNGRVVRQTQADNTSFGFSYTTDPITGNITQTDMTDPLGFVTRLAFNANRYTSRPSLTTAIRIPTCSTA